MFMGSGIKPAACPEPLYARKSLISSRLNTTKTFWKNFPSPPDNLRQALRQVLPRLSRLGTDQLPAE
jgi:hypothetical protein